MASPSTDPSKVAVPATPEKHLSWLDLLVIVALAVASFAASAVVRTGGPWAPRDQVPPLAVFQAQADVQARKEELALVQAQQAKIRELRVKRYADAVPGVTPSPTRHPSGKPSPPAPVSTAVLQSEAAALATQYKRQQLALADAERRAERARAVAVNGRAWTDNGVRVLVSFAVLVVLFVVFAALGRRSISIGAVAAGSATALLLLIIADAFSWVIAAAAALLVVVVLVRKSKA